MILLYGKCDTSTFNKIESFCLKHQSIIQIIESLSTSLDENDTRKKVAFASNFDEFINLIDLSEQIFYIHVNEEKIFVDLILNRITNQEYKNKIWPSFCLQTKKLFEYSRKKLVAIDCSTEESLKKFLNFLKSGNPIEAKYLMNSRDITRELNKELPTRDNNQIWTIFNQTRNKYTNFYEQKFNYFLSSLKEKHGLEKTLVINEIIETLDYQQKYIIEEDNSIKKSFAKNIPLCTTLINEIKLLIQQIKSNDNNILQTQILGLANLMPKFFYGDFADNSVVTDFLELTLIMFDSNNPNIRLKSNEILNTIFKRVEYAKDKVCFKKTFERDLLEKNFSVIIESCNNIFSCLDTKNISKLSLCYKKFDFNGLKLIIKSNCDFMYEKVDVIINLLDNGMKSFGISAHYFHAKIICELMSLLSSILENGKQFEWSNINLNKLMRYSAIMIEKSLNTFGAYSKKFVTMANELYKSSFYLCERFYFKKFDFDLMYNDQSFFDSKRNMSNENVNEERQINSVIDSYNKFMMLKKENLIDCSVRFIRDRTEYSVKYNELEFELKEYKKKLEKNELELFKEEIRNLNRDLKSKNEKISTLKTRLNLVDNVPVVISENKIEKSKEILSDKNPTVINDKDDAKLFIQHLENKCSNISDFRKFMCGSLKNLSLNLYTSHIQFFHEIIQNTEDAFASKVDSVNEFKIIIDENFISFCSNENGFRKEDVESICSLSESNKLKGKNIGNKGIGFKSVFIVSNNPIIYSKPYWQFYFLKESNHDEIAYITPHYLHDENKPDELKNIIEENQTSNTFIYLPLKPNLCYSNINKAFYENFVNAIDPNILLFTKKMNTIIIEDKIKSSKRVIKRFKKENLVTIEDENESLVKSQNFKVFDKIIEIDDKNLILEEELSSNQIEISIAFSEEKQEFGVYSFLPILNENVKFPFVVNSNWSLITNREKIRDCELNEIIRDSLAKFLTEKILNDETLLRNKFDILPSTDNRWWQNFMKIIKSGFDLESKNDDKKKKLRNNELQTKLNITKEILDLINIEIIECNSGCENRLEFYFEVFSIQDILEFFDIKNFSVKLEEWISIRSLEWWDLFFYEMYINKIKLKDSRKYRLFLQRETLNENSEKLVFLDKNTTYFTCRDLDIKMWRNNIQILNPRSIWEEKYLYEVLNVQELKIENIIEIINAYHFQTSDSTDVWNDLKFLKKYYEKFNTINLSQIFLPIKNDLIPAQHAKIPSILGYDLTNLNFIDQEKIIDFESINKEMELSEILEWEYFFIKLGADLPDFKYDVEYKFADSLRPLDQFSNQDVHFAMKILNEKESFCNFIKLIPIECTDFKERPLQSVYLQSVFSTIFPSVHVPTYALNLAEKIGINIKPKYNSCINALEYLVNVQNKDRIAYFEWLTRLELFSDQIEENLKNKRLLCLENINQKMEFFSPNDVYICENNYIIKKLCAYTGRTFIDDSLNREFMQYKKTLLSLGAKTEVSIDDLVLMISLMSQDANLFDEKGFLSEIGFTELKYIYIELEKCLQKQCHVEINEDFDFKTIDKLSEIVEQFLDSNILFELPMITFSKQIVSSKDLKFKKLACSLFSSINKQFYEQKSNIFHIVNEEIAFHCPVIMIILKCVYLENFSVVTLSHCTNNMETMNEEINRILRQETGIEDLELVNVYYIGVSLCFDSNLNEPVRKETFHSIDFEKEEIRLSNYDYVIFNKNLIFCENKVKNKEAQLNVYKNSIIDVLKSNNSGKSGQCINQIAESCKQKIEKYKFDEKSPQGSSEISIYIIWKIIITQPNYHEFLLKAEELTHNSNFPKINDTSLISRSLIKMNDEMTVEEYRKRVLNGQEAEYFFYLILQNIYGDTETNINWLSSAKQKIFPNDTNYNDSLGYDFVIENDFKKIFSAGHKCFIEVKSCGNDWDGTFLLTENQKLRKESLDNNKNESYVIVVVENVNDHSKINLTRIINWSKCSEILTLKNETFLATFGIDDVSSTMKTSESSGDDGDDLKGFLRPQCKSWNRNFNEKRSNYDSGQGSQSTNSRRGSSNGKSTYSKKFSTRH
ncbi:unnamed protein product [Brachionus calyciflorus]|uniref:Protein NO VEIN C-terminal domain-containing protein n=1 Tax=Brachionus calyciflorus TaxID=104777 RepID=A0A814ATA7_9BILA|nr:unnamed protein product [Brachionus calyciflorus]